MKKKLISMLLVCSMIFGLTACSGANDKKEENAVTDTQESETRIFTDDCGREVEIPSEITRIVPSGPPAQIILFSIAPEMFVGLSNEWTESARGIIADEYFDLPYLGQLYNTANLNVEELAMADPQVLIDIGEKKDTLEDDLNTLQEQTNIPAVFISSSLETMPETYRTLGKLLGKEEKAEELARFCEKVYDRTISIMEEVGENKVNALYVLGEEGLNVIANGAFQAEVIDMLTNNLAVVDNPMSKGSGNEVTLEQIALWNPDFILFAQDSIYDIAAEKDTWKEMTAIANDNYVKVPEGPHNWLASPPSVQRYLGLIWLTAELYPDYCDYDVKAEIMEYYKLFYGCDLTEEQYDTLTKDAFLK